MRCVKCAAVINMGQCPQCGFDHTKRQVRFLSEPAAKDVQLTAAVNAAPVAAVLKEAKKQNAEALVNVLKEVKVKQIQEKTAVTSDGMFEIYDGKVLRRYNGSEANVIVPSYVKHIAQGAFGGKDFCRTVCLPEGLESIGSVAFEKCSELETINLPQGLKDIGIRTFYDCKKLKQIEIPGSVTFICPQAFGRCTALEKVVFQYGIKKVDMDIFGGCSSLQTIHVPDSVQEILPARGGRLTHRIQIQTSEKWVREQEAFFRENPNYLPVHSIADGLEITGDCLLAWHGKQARVVIPSGVREIAENAFANNLSIRVIELPDGLEIIGERAFSGCGKLEEIRLPQTLREIRDEAFRGTGISGIEIPEGVTYVAKGAFRDCKGLKEVVLPKGQMFLYMSWFQGCSELQRIIVPDSLSWLMDEDVLKRHPHKIQLVASQKWIDKNKAFFSAKWKGFQFEASDVSGPESWFRFYRKAAEDGNPYAQWKLSECYENGTGVKKDLKQAVYWLEKACDNGWHSRAHLDELKAQTKRLFPWRRG